MSELIETVQQDVLEVTPLLSSLISPHEDEQQPLRKTQPRTRCSWPWTRVIAICAAIVISANIADYLSKAPKIRLFESIICSKHWLQLDPSVVRGDGSVPEALCKVDVVQDQLASILGWQLFFDAIPAILLPIPYGWLADRYGRKWILVAGLLGITASFAWILVVVGLFDLPLQLVWLSSLFSLLGGGVTVATALLLTMVADVTPAEKRSNTFFYLLTCQLLDECVIPPLTAFLMAKSTYVPLIAGVVTLAFSTVLSLALPETLPVSDFSGKTPELSDNTASELQDKYEMSKGWLSGFESSFAFATRNTTVMALILSYVIYEVGQQATDLLLLYVSKRYGWTLSKAGLLLSLRAGVNVILFALVLPLLSTFVYFRKSAILKDLWIARASIVLLGVGVSILFVSVTPAIMIAGVVVYTFGTGFTVVIRSLATAAVETTSQSNTSDVARLYTLMSLMAGIGNLVAGPGMAWVFRMGIKLGQAWLGLPFAIAAVLFLVITPVVFMVRV